MLKKNKILLCILGLATIAVVGLILMIGVFGVPGQDVYSGVDLQKAVQLGEYKGVTIQVPEGTSEDVIKRNILSRVTMDSNVDKYPQRVIKKYIKENTEYYEEIAKGYGYETLDTYVAEQFQYTASEFAVYIEEYSKSKVKDEMVVMAIAEAEGLAVTDEEVKASCDEMLAEEGYTEETFAEVYGMSINEYAKKEKFKFRMLQDKVQTLLYENATVEHL